MGNVELLTNIGQLLDELPASGSDAPEWGTAMKIVTDHYDYVRRCGQRLPGTILAAPFYSGRHGKWGFKVELCDGLNLAKLDLCVGPEDDTCARKARLSNNDDSDRAANSVGEIGEGLKKAGIVFNA